MKEPNAAFPPNLRYSKEHEWVRVEGSVGIVGITHYAQSELGDVVFVDLPEKGRALTAGQELGTIESVKAVSELYSPVSGEVVEVNTALKDKPETVNKDPHGSWMVVVKLTNASEAASLLDAAQYQDMVK